MKKETTIAVILGVAFGTLLGLYLITKNKEMQLSKNKVIAPTGIENKAPSPGQINFQLLEISAPQDGEILETNSVTIKGKITKNSLIVIQSPIKESVFNNNKEDFSINFPLALGENVIKIVAYPKDRQLSVQEKSLRVYYLKETL